MGDYDPTSGRYLQADPLGLIDGASVYGCALQNPRMYTDPRGEEVGESPEGSASGIGHNSGPSLSCPSPCEVAKEKVRAAKNQRPKACRLTDSRMALFY